MSCRSLVNCVGILLALTAIVSGESPRVEFTEQEITKILTHSPLPPVPADPTNRFADDAAAAHLGQYVFFDKRLSINGEFSCASCHDPEKSFGDGKPVPEALDVVTRNSPSLWNVAYNRWFFWDGRADSLWSQALTPVEAANEMDGTRLGVAHLIQDDPKYREAYENVFGAMPDLSDESRFPADGRPVPSDLAHPFGVAWSSMSQDDQRTINRLWSNVGKAIAAYERRLISKHSPFDIFVEGLRSGDEKKQAMLSESAKRGLKLFIGRGKCRSCHVGPNFTDGEFHNIQVPSRAGGQPTDSGRYAGVEQLKADIFNALGEFSDDREGSSARKIKFLNNPPDNWGRFKVPSLRNVALNAPYMQEGQFDTLNDVVHYYSTLEGAVRMGHHQESVLAPLELSSISMQDLIAFLESLTDDALDPALKHQPASPLLTDN